MNAAAWERIKSLLADAADLPVSGRERYVADRCPDLEMRREVLELLAASPAPLSDLLAIGTAPSGPQGGSAAFPEGRFPAGTVFADRYRIIELLGHGGMGEVYRADDLKLGQPVALKFLLEHVANDSERLARFHTEVRLARQVSHPNICRVYDIGEVGGATFLSMEYVDGEDLHSLLRRIGRVPGDKALEIARCLCAGLAAAHDKKVLHRDLKPANILIDGRGHVLITDFGVAGLIGDTHLKDVREGTPAYMAPEQLAGKAASVRSDIYALGLVLHEMFTGKPAFTSARRGMTPTRIMPDGATGLDARVDDAISRCLEEKPHNRPASVLAVAAMLPGGDALAEALAAGETPSPNVVAAAGAVGGVDLRRVSRHSESAAALRQTPEFRRVPRWPWIAASAAIIVLAISGVALWRAAVASRVAGSAAAPIRSIAVLPLENLSRDADQEFFSDGTTDALISSLAQIHALAVTSRASTMHYKGTAKSLREIARELRVDAILTGTVQRAGGRVRITAQLIRASTDTHVWANEYEREMSDILKLEADVARAIAQEIRVQVTPDETRRLASARSVRPDAHEAYLLGRFHFLKNNETDYKQAIEYFKKAIRLQPDYALAHVGLAETWVRFRGFRLTDAGADEMRSAARTALDLDPDLAEAHATMGAIKEYDWDWIGAQREFERALQLNPGVENDLSSILSARGRHQEAIEICEREVSANPISARAHFGLGLTLGFAGRLAEALPHFQRALELEPQSIGARLMIGVVFQQTRKFPEALAIFEQDFPGSAYLALTYALQGRRADALKIVNNLVQRGGGPDFQEVALVYFTLGDKVRGFAWLTKAFDQRQSYVTRARVNWLFDESVRADPRFKALVARLNLPD